MTNLGAIEYLSGCYLVHGDDKVDAFCAVNNSVIDAAISALKKQLPKKPTGKGFGYSDNRCPMCKAHVSYELDYGGNLHADFCPDCGQAIDWRGADE